MIIWQSTPDIIWIKDPYSGSFYQDLGDIPILRYNEKTKKFESVVNNRGRAYGLRNARKFRNKKKYSRK